MMDAPTALVLTVQLVALFSIAGALLLYLLCKIRGSPGDPGHSDTDIGGGRAVLVTSFDTAFGLQIALHLSSRGFRVFAGVKNPNEDSVAMRMARSWKERRDHNDVAVSIGGTGQGALITLPFDVTREDVLHEAADIIRANLPAGEDGIWAVINTTSVVYRGKLEQQDASQWDAMLRTNVVGVLRTARAFHTLLRSAQGRFITIGAPNSTTEMDNTNLPGVAYLATRHAVQGASDALRSELAGSGIKVVTLAPNYDSLDKIFAQPRMSVRTTVENSDGTASKPDCVMSFHPKVLSTTALNSIEVALTCGEPKNCYSLTEKTYWCRPIGIIQNV